MPIVNPTAETHPERYGYRIPTIPYVSYRTFDGGKLHDVENRRNEAIHNTAVILQRMLGLQDEWKDALPEALASILESMDSHASDAAAIAYLRKRGYEITDKTEGH